MAHAFRIGETQHDVWLARSGRGYVLHLGTQRVAFELRACGEHAFELLLAGQVLPVFVSVAGDDIHVHANGEAHTLRHVHSLERFASEAADRSDAVSRAPMPGSVIAVPVHAGQRVGRGDTLMVIESMKMETVICAALDGEVQSLHLQVGQTFERDALLVTLNPLKAAA